MAQKVNRSDAGANEAFIKELQGDGYEIIGRHHPVDITAAKDGETFYFEIKKTSKPNRMFGAATFTEWEQALKHPNHFWFVLAKEINENEFEFIKVTPEIFMKYSTIPPIKVYFNIHIDEIFGEVKAKTRNNRSAIEMSEEKFKVLSNAYEKCKQLQELERIKSK